MIRKTLAVALLATVAAASAAQARDQIRIAGSSTVFPFTTRVAEEFGKTTKFKTPVIESTGTGGGFKLFCAGVGVEHTDISNASRAIKQSEIETCAKNGVTEITEVKIGYDGIVIASSKASPQLNITLPQLFMALAKDIPDGKGGLMPNPHKLWSDVDPSLPKAKIEVLGPPPTSGTRDAFLELAMTPGAEAIPGLAALAESDEDRFETIAHTVREDGRWIDSGENDNAIVQTLTRTPGALGVFGYSFLEENMTSVKAASIRGVQPNATTIADGSYPLSRSLYIYVKISHLQTTPGLEGFVEEFLSDAAAGTDGYLADRGMIPLPADQLAAVRAAVRARTAMVRPS